MAYKNDSAEQEFQVHGGEFRADGVHKAARPRGVGLHAHGPGLVADFPEAHVEGRGVSVPRAEHATTKLAEGDQLEVVHFVGGG